MSTGTRWYWFILQLAATGAGIAAGMAIFDAISS